MTSETLTIREVLPKDNKALGNVIRNVLEELGAPKVGTAYEDKATDLMFENYENVVGHYYVIEENNTIIGGCGFAKLSDNDTSICELQKMYLLPEARGRGLGSKLITICLEKAKEMGFDKCYLETLPYMESAQKLYKKNGFINLDGPIGETGHYSCTVWMIKDL